MKELAQALEAAPARLVWEAVSEEVHEVDKGSKSVINTFLIIGAVWHGHLPIDSNLVQTRPHEQSSGKLDVLQHPRV